MHFGILTMVLILANLADIGAALFSLFNFTVAWRFFAMLTSINASMDLHDGQHRSEGSYTAAPVSIFPLLFLLPSPNRPSCPGLEVEGESSDGIPSWFMKICRLSDAAPSARLLSALRDHTHQGNVYACCCIAFGHGWLVSERRSWHWERRRTKKKGNPAFVLTGESVCA